MVTMSNEYQRLHYWIRKLRGKASTYECVDCGEQARDWSLVHDKDPDKIMNYEPRCRKCHIAYDGHSMLGRKHSEESREKMSEAHLDKEWSDERRANHKVSQQLRRQKERELGTNIGAAEYRERGFDGRFL